MTWTLDKQHLDLGFSVKHMMVSNVKGRFTDVDAEIELNEEHPEASSVRATVAVGSLSTGNPDRDAHLTSGDFLDAEQFPRLTFVSTEVRRKGDEAFELTGDLTIRDVTRPVTLIGEFTGPVASPWGDRRFGFSLNGSIDREDFGLIWNVALETGGVVVGKKINLTIDAEVAAAVEVAA
ncbi:MAG: polyisoprenoid-binding protein [Chloroflexi bacterium]|nr:MAG: polyisoprenoid-binding protein [Chloroflexota bacterium]